MKNILIVDAYNAIQRTKEFFPALDASLEAARAAFVDRINRYIAKKHTFDEIIAAFDAAANKTEESRRTRCGAVTVIFSSFGESADDLIKSLIKENADSCRITVVSDDNYVINNSRALGAAVMTCKAFMDSIGVRDAESKQQPSVDEKGLDAKAKADINEQLKKEWNIG